ncbi:MAG: type II toxin-antitoxin system VapC family toxin [Planctomycetes bacterium]|nr:type II toxin-antitoxin system VapC family toxin [Planctomycetota bacterium]
MGLALDTSALVDLERSGSSIETLAPDGEVEIFVPAIAVAELWIGTLSSSSRKVRERRETSLLRLLAGLTVLAFTHEIAPTYAKLFVQQRKAGKPIPANDLPIAATALYHGHELLVGRSDEAHFRSVRGLKVRVLV